MAEFTIPDDILSNIKDQVILITGGSSGIGRTTAELCANLGAKVVIGDLKPPLIEPPSDPLHTNIKFVPVDVTSWQSLRLLFDETDKLYGGIDHVFANAGVAPTTDFLNLHPLTPEQLEPPDLRTIQVNLTALLYTVHLSTAYMKSLASRRPLRPTGSIVLAGSATSYQTFRAGDYTIAKHGVLGMIRGMTVQLEAEGSIRLNAVTPSWTETGIIPTMEALREMGVQVQAPEVVARSVVLLFADEKRHGEVIYSWAGRYKEVNKAEGGLLSVVKRLNFDGDHPNEDMQALWEQMTNS
ncbi:hypothetical protein PDE_04604 [Penicillium oxalicum 114-2]|uniref:Uncharacterized protein n=1 Tax=Penicillium oxalicum (strain 114-2 / CGMCC 5302) TaxID=933388 RepID=S7ZH97_PENO1|nr:hypothetical protein PDE_04604 [Penicillium oxalicum 114-2]